MTTDQKLTELREIIYKTVRDPQITIGAVLASLATTDHEASLLLDTDGTFWSINYLYGGSVRATNIPQWILTDGKGSELTLDGQSEELITALLEIFNPAGDTEGGDEK